MTNKLTKTPGWIWREDELSLKEYYKLSYIDKEKYIQQLELLLPEEQSSTDQYLLRFYSNKKSNKNFISLD